MTDQRAGDDALRDSVRMHMEEMNMPVGSDVPELIALGAPPLSETPTGPPKLPLPGGWRMIASGDVVPVFDPHDPPVYLVFHDDGRVTWSNG